MGRLQASLLGGLFIGVLSVLPIVNLLNLCCCLWVVAGGILTTYLRQQGATVALESTEAALIGLGAGFTGGVLSALGSFLMFSAIGDAGESIRQIASQFPLPPEMRAQVLSFDTSSGFVLLSNLMTVPVYAFFGLIGALLGLLIFRKPQAPAAQA